MLQSRGSGGGSARNRRGSRAVPVFIRTAHREDGTQFQTLVSEQPLSGEQGGVCRKWDAGGQGSCQAGFPGATEAR